MNKESRIKRREEIEDEILREHFGFLASTNERKLIKVIAGNRLSIEMLLTTIEKLVNKFAKSTS